MDKYELRLDELKVFCEDLLDSYEIDGLLEFNQENLEKLMMHWEDYFAEGEEVITFTDEIYQQILDDFDKVIVSEHLRKLVSEGLVDVQWDDNLNDFTFKKAD